MVKLGGGGSFINRAYPVTFYMNEIGGTVCLDLNILKLRVNMPFSTWFKNSKTYCFVICSFPEGMTNYDKVLIYLPVFGQF